MSERESATDELTTAEALGKFARELVSYPDIPFGAVQDLVFEAGRQLIAGTGSLAVKSDV